MWSHSEDGHAHIRWEVGGLDFALFMRAAEDIQDVHGILVC